MHVLIGALLAFVLVAPAQAQVTIDIGIHLPAPPQLVIVPEVHAVQYVPTAPGNLFFYNGQYWAFTNGAWYLSAGYRGPWIVVAPQFVPRPVLLVPIRYYHAPPGHWKTWEHKRPPRWSDEWGREWADKRAWKHRDRDDDDDRRQGRGRDRDRDDDDRGKGRGRGHGKNK
ncbi:MAG: hypothetical protein ACREM3_19325 [Candidatus Rokuibacteriota bacterium]